MTADTNDVDWNEAELSCLDAAARAAASAWFSSSVFLPIAFGFGGLRMVVGCSNKAAGDREKAARISNL